MLFRDEAVLGLRKVESDFNQEFRLAEEEACHRMEVTTHLKGIYAEVAQLSHIAQLEDLRSRPTGSPETCTVKDVREYSRYVGADHDALIHAEAAVGVGDSASFDGGFLRDHNARRGISAERVTAVGESLGTSTGRFLGQPVGPRKAMDASSLLLGPSVNKPRAKRTRKAQEGLVKNLMEVDPSKYGIPSRFANAPGYPPR
jgi:hypothetical protein